MNLTLQSLVSIPTPHTVTLAAGSDLNHTVSSQTRWPSPPRRTLLIHTLAGTSGCPFSALMVGGTSSATHFIVLAPAYQPPRVHSGSMGTHTYQGFTSTQAQIDMEAGASPQGVNINICPCHTHKGEGCRLVWPHEWQRADRTCTSSFFFFLLIFTDSFQKVSLPLLLTDILGFTGGAVPGSHPLYSLSSL